MSCGEQNPLILTLPRFRKNLKGLIFIVCSHQVSMVFN